MTFPVESDTRLSPAQIRALWEIKRAGSWPGAWVVNGDTIAPTCMRALERRGLVESTLRRNYRDDWVLTEKGESVAAKIQKAENVVPLRRIA